MSKIWNWLVWSSANTDKISLTLKGFIPYLAILLAWKGIDQAVVAPMVGSAVDGLVGLIVNITQVVSGLVALLGLVRKIYNTIKLGTS